MENEMENATGERNYDVLNSNTRTVLNKLKPTKPETHPEVPNKLNISHVCPETPSQSPLQTCSPADSLKSRGFVLKPTLYPC